ncbi:selenoprotein N isoform X4 [Canis lupus dingo]|uniref:Selenoprotein N n=1 Tax=Canis lupus familiaris TaxID=9615 RepID=A0A8I3S095_CANLF|nr:selenoprotein N isoform X4 [Canis lupus dingo]
MEGSPHPQAASWASPWEAAGHEMWTQTDLGGKLRPLNLKTRQTMLTSRDCSRTNKSIKHPTRGPGHGGARHLLSPSNTSDRRCTRARVGGDLPGGAAAPWGPGLRSSAPSWQRQGRPQLPGTFRRWRRPRGNQGLRTQEPKESALKALGTEGLFLFSSLDTDRDMYISPEEFKPIAEKLTGSTPAASYEEEELPLDPSEETLTIEARFQPLIPESMTKSKDGFLGVSRLALSGLRNWTTAAVPSAVFAARHFRPFLPLRGQVALGEPWWIIPSELSVFTGYLSNNRFYPPPPKGKEVIIHRLLSMFHPRPFVKTRFAPQGAVACLTAISDFYYTVMFRIHAEFQLSEPPDFPFWFSPGQFTGHIILSKDATHIRDFRLFVPNHRSLNVDMEWLYGASESSNMEVDIGYIPQMELEATGPSVPSMILDEDGNMIDSRPPSGEPLQFVFEEIKWQQELSWEEAARRLEVAMYPFKKVQGGLSGRPSWKVRPSSPSSTRASSALGPW